MATAKAYSQTKIGDWNYLYILLGFILAIEGDIIQLLELERLGIVLYFVIAGLAVWLILFCRPAQDPKPKVSV